MLTALHGAATLKTTKLSVETTSPDAHRLTRGRNSEDRDAISRNHIT
jgi:hypothetical protein